MESDQQFNRFAALTNELESVNRSVYEQIQSSGAEIKFLQVLGEELTQYNKRARKALNIAKETLAKIKFSYLA